MNANHIPAGFVLVPREPTMDMYDAAVLAYQRWSAAEVPDSTFTHIDVWNAMIASAPSTADLVAHETPNASDNGACVQPASGEVADLDLDIAAQGVETLLDALLPGFECVGVSLRVSAEDHAAIRSAMAGARTSLRLIRNAIQSLATPPAAPVVAEPADLPQAAPEAEADPYFGVQDEVALTRAVCVMDDVLTDIEGWEDQELANAVKESRIDLCAMIEVIRMRADPSYVCGSKPIDGNHGPLATPPASPQAPAPQAAVGEGRDAILLRFLLEHCMVEDEYGALAIRWSSSREPRHHPMPERLEWIRGDLEGEAKKVGLTPSPAPSAAPHQGADALREAVATSLCDLYVCSRVWEAWQVGTMSQDDFSPALENDDVIDNITSAVVAALAQHQAPQGTKP